MKRVSGYWMMVAAFIFSIATIAYVSFAPMVTSVEESGHVNMTTEEGAEEELSKRQSEVRQVTLPEAQGWGAVVIIAGPLFVLTGLPLFARTRRQVIVLRGGSTIFLVVGVFLGALSFGLFYLPPAVLMFVATVMVIRSMKIV